MGRFLFQKKLLFLVKIIQMKILLLPIFFFSAAVYGQENEEKLSTERDTLKIKTIDSLGLKKSTPEYKILVSKPENPSMYSSLKAEKTDSVKYKILNSFEKRKKKKDN